MVAEKVEKIKTKLWLGIVLYYSGAKNPNHLDKRIYELEHGDTKNYVSQSRIWYRYEKAEDIPRLNTVERINKILPDTAYYFNHPFWEILAYDSYSFLEINRLISNLEPCIMGKILYIEEIGGSILKRVPTTKKLLHEIEANNSLDVLMVTFLLYSEAIDQNDSKRYLVLNFAEKYIKKLQRSPELRFTQNIVFEFILSFFTSLEQKNELNFIHKEDYEIYKKIKIIAPIIYSKQDRYDAVCAFNKIRDFYD